MTRFILDTGIAGLYLARQRGVFERAQVETAKGNRVGIAGPVLAELAFRAIAEEALQSLRKRVERTAAR